MSTLISIPRDGEDIKSALVLMMSHFSPYNSCSRPWKGLDETCPIGTTSDMKRLDNNSSSSNASETRAGQGFLTKNLAAYPLIASKEVWLGVQVSSGCRHWFRGDLFGTYDSLTPSSTSVGSGRLRLPRGPKFIPSISSEVRRLTPHC